MSIPLYLKYRPSKLSELIGQDIIVRTFTNSINNNKLGHAYLLTGPRGCGKTSTARIFAKSLNCKEGQSSNPCGKCINCIEISQGISPDVIELDAASNRKVEDIEPLIEKSYYAAQTAKYKIYILDEIHMFSGHAFNALLKTIEEPPPNVIFILATTEEHKVLATIISRCQRFLFKPIDEKSLNKRLIEIAKLENINITESAISIISKLSRGGFRDALSLLDQIGVLSSENQVIDKDLVSELFGKLSDNLLENLTNALLNYNFEDTLKACDEILNKGIDPVQGVKNLIEYQIDLIEQDLEKKTFDINKKNRLLEIIEECLKLEQSLKYNTQSALRFKASMLSFSLLIASPPTPLKPPNPLKGESNLSSILPLSPTPLLKEKEIERKSDDPLETLINNVKLPPFKALLSQQAFIISDTQEVLTIGIGEAFFNKINDESKIAEMRNILGKNVIIKKGEKPIKNPPTPLTEGEEKTSKPPSPLLENDIDIEDEEYKIVKVAQEYLGAKLVGKNDFENNQEEDIDSEENT